MTDMNAQDIINYIANSEKKTPVKVYVNLTEPVDFAAAGAKVFGEGLSRVVFGDWTKLEPVLAANADKITDLVIENDRRNSGVPTLDLKNIKARIEPGAVIREKVEIGEGAVIMMGAVINIGAVIGKGTMIDMGAVLGGRAIVGDHCHIGAGTVLAGVVEPASATPVVVEDNVMIGANAVVIEGVRIGRNAVVGAGAIVISDVPPNAVVVGNPTRVIKMKDEKTEAKTALVDALRKL
ncbi:MAG: 2,3,4,5-tetrahydropyridine-2,6-dicarboxylate N-acetyltransferase [Sutterella sp.]|nr:2,3,4,5-tetrahydropyridine-2,6-dicarboxylate N-acetyltransferase [Sutterella sp.]